MILLRSLLFHTAFYGGTIVISLLVAPLIFAPSFVARALGRFWGWYTMVCLRLAGVSCAISGDKQLSQPVIYAAKHQSTFETMMLFHMLRAPIVVLKIELMKLPIIGRFLAKIGAIALDRSAPIKSLKLLQEKTQGAGASGTEESDSGTADSGRSLLIFPQGTRVDFGKKAPYKIGVFAVYEAAGLPVIPIALDSGRYLPHRSFFIRPGKIQMRFLAPIQAGLPRREFMAALESAIETEMLALEQAGPQPRVKSKLHPNTSLWLIWAVLLLVAVAAFPFIARQTEIISAIAQACLNLISG